MQWCLLSDVEAACADLQQWLDRCPQPWGYYATAATGEARSYLNRYRDFFDGWEGGNAPEELERAVAILTVRNIVAASGMLAPQALEESIYERNAREVIAWLKLLSSGAAELYLDWGLLDDDTAGSRATLSIRDPEREL